jgi:TatD DNase family protein
MIDSCHLRNPKFSGDVDAVSRGRRPGRDDHITIGTGIEDATRAHELAPPPGVVFPTAAAVFEPRGGTRVRRGFHRAGRPASGRALRRWARSDVTTTPDPRAVQAERFERQLDLAARLDLPVVIHVREAHDDMAAILAAHSRNRGVIHSFTGRASDAERYLAIGWHLAFNGVITFKNAGDLRSAARVAPAERLLVETDSPFLAPVPKRGTRCEPAFAVHAPRPRRGSRR